ncbi:Hypothetical predicted protein [Marmota monax]|nr:Hypothetical predicted protein [Marmota monax]
MGTAPSQQNPSDDVTGLSLPTPVLYSLSGIIPSRRTVCKNMPSLCAFPGICWNQAQGMEKVGPQPHTHTYTQPDTIQSHGHRHLCIQQSYRHGPI